MGLVLPPPSDDDSGRRPDRGEHRTDLPPLDTSRPLGIVIPDDLTGLEDEIRAVQDELGIRPPPGNRRERLHRWLQRRAGVRRAPGAPPPPGGLVRSLLVGPVVALVLLIVAGLVALFPPSSMHSGRRPGTAQRLATPLQPPGTVGGLLPDVQLVADRVQIPSRSIRPAVIMLVPDGCACPDLVHQMIGQVEEYPGLSAALVGSGRDPAVAGFALARNGGNGRLPAYVDRGDVLARTYHANQPGGAPTVLFVAQDGVLTEPPLVFSAGTRIEAATLPLVTPLR